MRGKSLAPLSEPPTRCSRITGGSIGVGVEVAVGAISPSRAITTVSASGTGRGAPCRLPWSAAFDDVDGAGEQVHPGSVGALLDEHRMRCGRFQRDGGTVAARAAASEVGDLDAVAVGAGLHGSVRAYPLRADLGAGRRRACISGPLAGWLMPRGSARNSMRSGVAGTS